MNRKTVIRTLVVMCAAVLLSMAFAGCSSANNQPTEAQKANRTYLTQVNQAMEKLDTRLDGFSEAVSRGDVVTMRTQADDAFKVIDELSAIKTPDAMKDLQASYTDGCNQLEDALNAYIDLYTEIANADEAHPFDYSTYDARIKEVQDTYDSGVAKLQEADETALKLNEEGNEKQS